MAVNLRARLPARYDRVLEMSRPKIKGIVRAQRDAFVRASPGEFLSRGAEEALFTCSEILSEGTVRTLDSGERRYFGSTMITIDLLELQKRWRGELGPRQREQLLRLAHGSVRVRLRAARLACAEARSRVTDRPLGTAIVETTARLSGDTLQMDVDLEVPIGVCSSARRAP
jgi:hypothetical protein